MFWKKNRPFYLLEGTDFENKFVYKELIVFIMLANNLIIKPDIYELLQQEKEVVDKRNFDVKGIIITKMY